MEKTTVKLFRTFKKGMKANCTKPPRQREGLDTSLPHNVYPGGKTYRRALERLRRRNLRHMPDSRNGHERGTGYYAPGSPARQIAGSMK